MQAAPTVKLMWQTDGGRITRDNWIKKY